MAEFPFPQTPTVADPVIAPGTAATAARPVVNDAFARHESAITSLAASTALGNILIYGAGRFSDFPIVSAENPQIGTGLTVRLPNGVYLIEGHAVVIDNPEPEPYAVITDITPAKPDGVEVFVRINPDSGALETDADLQFDTFPSSDEDLATVKGLLHIGLVTTDLVSVTDLAPSTRLGFGIVPSLVNLANQYADHETRLAALEAGGGGGGGASAAEHLPWQTAGIGKDTRDTVTVVNQKLAVVLAAAQDAAQSGGEFESPSETDQLWTWLLGVRRVVGIAFPSLLRFLPGGGAQPGLFGTSSAPDTTQHDVGGTLPEVVEEREYDSR